MADLIVKSKVKDFVGDMSVGADFYDALNKEVETLINKAKARCKENNRSTLKARDV
jgi:histone H3/H4